MQYFKKIARSLTSILLHFMYFQKCSVALTACFCMPQPYNCPKACMYMNKCGNLWKLGQLLHLTFKSLIVKQYIVLWIVQCCWNTHCHLWYWDISQDGFCSSPRLKTFCTVLCKRPVQRFHKLSHSVPLWPPKFVPMPLSVPENRLWAASEKKDKENAQSLNGQEKIKGLKVIFSVLYPSPPIQSETIPFYFLWVNYNLHWVVSWRET